MNPTDANIIYFILQKLLQPKHAATTTNLKTMWNDDSISNMTADNNKGNKQYPNKQILWKIDLLFLLISIYILAPSN